MKKIIFVDDDPNVTDGLRRMLRPMRGEWEMSFALSGRDALDVMASEPFDIVISDMRMPGMDGSQFLTEVMSRHPQTIRFILSGYAESSMVLRSVGTAHQYLSKPCDANELKATVERACALRDLLRNDNLRLLVTRMQSLPSMPSLYLELTQELRADEVSLKKISGIIAKDPAMTAKMLQMVNSAFFGLRRHVSNAEDAVSLLGVDMIVSLVFSISVFSLFEEIKLPNFSLQKYWAHSQRVGKFAKWLAKSENQPDADLAMTAGMLHDVGKLVLAANLPEAYDELIAKAGWENADLEDLERQTFGATHSEVGGYLLGLWGLPNLLVEALVFHHRPSHCVSRNFEPLAAVHIANVLDSESQKLKAPSGGGGSSAAEFDYEYLAALQLTEKIPHWREKFAEQAALEE